jgi:soluble lytic murein transglycosylase-like protein
VRRLTLLTLACVGLLAPEASAELVVLDNGRHFSVRAYRLEGESLVLLLRSGGEIVFSRSRVASIRPDEVAYPEPVEAAATARGVLPEVPYADLIDATAARHGVDPRLVRALVQVESAYRPDARSPKGAMGLMQLMPQTARQYALHDPYDPQSNVEAGVRHLKSLLDRFDLSLALAAYNAGEGAVRRFGGVPPFRETRDYVSRVISLTTGP